MPKQNFNLENSLYPAHIVEAAISAFDGYDISFQDEVLTIDDEDAQLVFDEFSNYCIALSNETIA